MRFFIPASVVTLVALSPAVLGQGPKINTLTNPTTCEPVQFTWEGGAPPYYLSLVPGGQPAAAAIKQFPAQSGTSMTWKVDLPAGTTFSSSLRDSSGEQAFSDIQTVQSGPDTSCLNGSVSESASSSMTSASSSEMASSAATTNTATSTSMPSAAQKAVSTTASPSTGSGTASASGAEVHAVTSTSSGSSATATSSNAASLHTSAGAIGIAGLLGLVGAALLG
ncbi:hypothetical protein BD413DRAFT_614715 [Trametes elegans]|nr:hypothetical protein BD413DRAFT_614715 [Trametes elegans]